MNGCLIFFLMIVVFYRRCRERLSPGLARDWFADAARALRRRDYLLRSLREGEACERRLKEVLLAELRRGRLRIGELEEAGRYWEEARKEAEEGLNLAGSYALHLGFVVLVTLAFRLLLLGRIWLDRRDLLECGLAFAGLCLLLGLLERLWPRPILMAAAGLGDFVQAFLGDGEGTRFAADLRALQERSARDGFDPRQEQLAHLRQWHWHELASRRSRRQSLETALGPIELFTSVFFGTLLLGLPLLTQFAGLLGS